MAELTTHPGPQRQGDAVDLVLLGVIIAVLGGFGTRVIVRCDRDGIRVRLIRTKFVPVGEIGSVEVRPVYRTGWGAWGMLTVSHRDGSVVRLRPTLTHRYTWSQVDARLQPLVKRMRAALGLKDPMHPHRS